MKYLGRDDPRYSFAINLGADGKGFDFQAVLDKAIARKNAEYWVWDGIPPTVFAHELMAREWIKQVSFRLKFLEKIQA